MHHTAWTACSPHVLAGGSKAVELTHNAPPLSGGSHSQHAHSTLGRVGASQPADTPKTKSEKRETQPHYSFRH